MTQITLIMKCLFGIAPSPARGRRRAGAGRFLRYKKGYGPGRCHAFRTSHRSFALPLSHSRVGSQHQLLLHGARPHQHDRCLACLPALLPHHAALASPNPAPAPGPALFPDPSPPPRPRRAAPRARLVPATRVHVRGARPRSAPRGGVRVRSRAAGGWGGGGGAGEAAPRRPRLRRALRREGRLPQLRALGAGSHPGMRSALTRLFRLAC